ncbi:uncharacterized protein [Chamaea fasciata]|uniref:uncharacterized protein n=1 Tax=Chamaea fasciata TaxID=190680 RepID=UPI00336A9215
MFGFRESPGGFLGPFSRDDRTLVQFWRMMTLCPPEVLDALVSVVAVLGELAATMAGPDGDMLLALYPGSLHEELRTFSRRLRDTLDHGNVTSLGQRGVTSLSQALATTGDTWADVRAAVSAWQERVDVLYKSWVCLADKAEEIYVTFHVEIPKTDPVWDLRDRPANCRTARDNLMASLWLLWMTWISAVATGTREGPRRGWRVKDALGLLVRFVGVCVTASELPRKLQECLKSIEDALKRTQEVSCNVPRILVDEVNKFEWLWEGSARLARDHLLGTLGDIHDLLLSPFGSSISPGSSGGPGDSSGPVSPAGSDGPCGPSSPSGTVSSDGPNSPGGPSSPGDPGGRSVAKRRQEAIEDTPMPCKKQRTAPSCGETSNSSSMAGTPEQPEGTWGKPEPGAVCETASRLPKHPDVLPPGTRCELATSKLVRFIKDTCRECIHIGVTGISKHRQDFLIIGKDSNKTLGLSVIPAVVSANCDEELKVLALFHEAPLVIEPKTPIAIAIALPMNRNERAGYREIPCEGFNPVPNDRWVKQITKEQPELECSLTHMESGETVQITGMLDTGADVTAISHGHWPSDWNLGPPECLLTGFGGATECKQSKSEITVTGPEGKTADIRPYVVWDNSTVWGRDVMFQWRAKMELDS